MPTKETRTEKDFLGRVEIPRDALFGIHAYRARENFPGNSPFPVEWYSAVGEVKLAYYLSLEKFRKAIEKEGLETKLSFSMLPLTHIRALQEAAREVAEGLHFDSFILPAITGGAGTSINMNINEIIANVALMKLDKAPGDYEVIDPLLHANIFQSTNDVVPSALKLAVMRVLLKLESEINALRAAIEQKEGEYRDVLRPAYTQMQEAVPSSWGKLFSAYSEALSRDWWRVSRAMERIKVVNLGSGAIGTGISIPRFIIMDVIKQLQQNTGFPLTRSENLPDATSNLDPLVEVHAIMKALAVNLEKMMGDLRMLSSDLSRQGLSLPEVQAGSSIMPGKVNPVIPEYVISAAHKVYANDGLVTRLSAQGCLELNAYTPIIGAAVLESLQMLGDACRVSSAKLIQGLKVNAAWSEEKLWKSPSITTALIPYIGYHESSKIALMMKDEGLDVFAAARKCDNIAEDELQKALRPDNLLRLGYSLREL